MALILNIDTAIDTASFCIAQDGKVIALEINETRTEQAAWLHSAIQSSFSKSGLNLQNLDAIAVSNGPGSYTGLRIGLATAKGLCYALPKPLICINTLEIMASSIMNDAEDLICPMIDARRMEVFTAVYDKNLNIVQQPTAMIINENSFAELLTTYKILFTGNGSEKLNRIMNNTNTTFINSKVNASNMLYISENFYINKIFSNLAYCEPYYIKSVHLR